MRQRSRRRLHAVIAVAVAATSAGLMAARLPPRRAAVQAAQPSPPSSPDDHQRSGVEERVAPYVGVVLARETMELAPQVQARVVEIAVHLGDRVARGTVLARLDDRAVAAELSMATAAVEAADAEQRKAEADADYATERRVQREEGAREIRPGLAAVSPSELAQTVYQERLALLHFKASRAATREKQAKLRGLSAQLSDCTVRAPFDAVVAARYVDPGALVGASMPLLRLMRDGALRVRFGVPETAPTVAIGDRVRIAVGDRALGGTVEKIAPEIEPSSRMVVAEAGIDPGLTSAGLRAGSVVRVFAAGAASP
jgi:RND family efflux transporter MFP subunit